MVAERHDHRLETRARHERARRRSDARQVFDIEAARGGHLELVQVGGDRGCTPVASEVTVLGIDHERNPAARTEDPGDHRRREHALGVVAENDRIGSDTRAELGQ